MNNQDHPVISIKLGITNCYLIRGGTDYIMVDAGPRKIFPAHGKPFHAEVFENYLKT